jgi:transposase InsO family protein
MKVKPNLKTTDGQVRRLREEMTKHGKIGKAAMKAGMCENTARKYLEAEKLPSEMRKSHDWRTRADPFEKDWEEIEQILKDIPGLEAKILFMDLLRRKPEQYQEGQLRTFQRKVKNWRAQKGPDKKIFFAQLHRPGEAMQTDFTRASALNITIGGEPFPHLLCHSTLPYSNWSSATVCQSESMVSLKRGVQTALFRLGRVPQWHQTDNSTAATHRLGGTDKERGFNADYEDLMSHFGMKPRTIAVGEKEQNGDIEALNGALKRMLEQLLKLRGSRDFESEVDYEKWLWEVMQRANQTRSKRTAQELSVMRPLSVSKLPEYSEEIVTVSCWSTIRIKHNSYSVPSRLRGEAVKVRIYDDHLEIYYGQTLQLRVPRLLGRFGSRIDYRHMIWSLVLKPGAFARYQYREEFFPSLPFRKAYDRLVEHYESQRRSDLEYLRILHLAASTMESEVECALELLEQENQLPDVASVKALVCEAKHQFPEIPCPVVDLSSYDEFLSKEVSR